jgi:hypothetical protein
MVPFGEKRNMISICIHVEIWELWKNNCQLFHIFKTLQRIIPKSKGWRLKAFSTHLLTNGEYWAFIHLVYSEIATCNNLHWRSNWIQASTSSKANYGGTKLHNLLKLFSYIACDTPLFRFMGGDGGREGRKGEKLNSATLDVLNSTTNRGLLLGILLSRNSFTGNFCQISTWKISFQSIQRIFHGKFWPKCRKKNSKSPDFYNKFK